MSTDNAGIICSPSGWNFSVCIGHDDRFYFSLLRLIIYVGMKYLKISPVSEVWGAVLIPNLNLFFPLAQLSRRSAKSFRITLVVPPSTNITNFSAASFSVAFLSFSMTSSSIFCFLRSRISTGYFLIFSRSNL